MSRRQENTGRCYCLRCAQKIDGFSNQSTHLKKYGPGPRHPDFRKAAPIPPTPPSAALQVLAYSTNNLARQMMDSGSRLIASTSLGRREPSAVESEHMDEENQVRSRSPSFDFTGTFSDQGNDHFAIPNPRDSLELNDEPVMHPLDRRPLPLSQIPASQNTQYSEIPTEQELQEFAAIKNLLPSDAVPAASRESAAVRLIYLHAVKASIFHNHTDDDCNRRITEDLDILDAAGILPTNPAPARTLVTAKRRLSLHSEATDLYCLFQALLAGRHRRAGEYTADMHQYNHDAYAFAMYLHILNLRGSMHARQNNPHI